LLPAAPKVVVRMRVGMGHFPRFKLSSDHCDMRRVNCFTFATTLLGRRRRRLSSSHRSRWVFG